MHIPIYSTVTLFAEIVVSTIIFYTFYQGYKNNRFSRLAWFAIAYEILFNISYMAYRSLHHSAGGETGWKVALAAFHGSLSLVMFLSLIIFLFLAWRGYKTDANYFKIHKNFTFIFLFFWSLAVLSGILFYFVEYMIWE